MGSFIFVVLVLSFIWIVRGLAKADQRRQQARQAGFTEEEINRIDQKNLAIQTFLAGLIVGPATFIGMILLTCLLVWVLFPVGLLATLALWSLYLKWLRSFYRGELTCPHRAPQLLPSTSAWQNKNSNGISLRQ